MCGGCIGQLKAYYIAALCRIVAIPSILVAKDSRTPVLEDVLEVVGEQYFCEVTGSYTGAWCELGIGKDNIAKVFSRGLARAL